MLGIAIENKGDAIQFHGGFGISPFNHFQLDNYLIHALVKIHLKIDLYRIA